jgi:hypothetical protein
VPSPLSHEMAFFVKNVLSVREGRRRLSECTLIFDVLAATEPHFPPRRADVRVKMQSKYTSPSPLSHGIASFSDYGLKYVVSLERGEVEGRFALENTWFRPHSRPKVVILFGTCESAFFFRR